MTMRGDDYRGNTVWTTFVGFDDEEHEIPDFFHTGHLGIELRDIELAVAAGVVFDDIAMSTDERMVACGKVLAWRRARGWPVDAEQPPDFYNDLYRELIAELAVKWQNSRYF
jgi:hypothetical protein